LAQGFEAAGADKSFGLRERILRAVSSHSAVPNTFIYENIFINSDESILLIHYTLFLNKQTVLILSAYKCDGQLHALGNNLEQNIKAVTSPELWPNNLSSVRLISELINCNRRQRELGEERMK
jgi:hypothetical protein